ncbi:hypothetical protein [Helicobacter mustelae]|uniref:Putative outer membrane protein n=1 Tax=Helicobacter mustelae (strain ATCC 43772 / CCUG 25715 / CIP 103759 / LMG 18044 / NCTC 12198 / R85-136P) TaxID=679897 RepID=D3UJE4_HELM1|nr:hypothetical protein [Helicobacter mustelae]CBG40620.1 Putative outer membrane protein [Helicobacter mustelae 12198]SQH72118.1 outer membrane protein [Helicobacter mustelae]STP13261.1 outer membrane protein [Helicobacter mustelae]
MKFFSILLSTFFLFGCFGSKPEHKALPARAKTCDSPHAIITPPTIKAEEKNDLAITPEKVKEGLNYLIQDGCLVIGEGADAYSLDISYESELHQQQVSLLVVSDEENTAKLTIEATLKKQGVTRTFKSTKNISHKGKKILGIGSNTEITKDDIDELLNSTLLNVYDQILKNIK